MQMIRLEDNGRNKINGENVRHFPLREGGVSSGCWGHVVETKLGGNVSSKFKEINI